MSLIQKSSNFALGTCTNCTSPVFPCGVGRYPLINHIYIIKKIRVFFGDDFGDKILWALLKVRGLLRFTFFFWILKGDPKRYRVTQRDTGWPKEIQGDSKGYSVTQWDTGWLSETQGDPKIYMVTQRATGWLNEIQGNPKRYRVTQWDTGWLKRLQDDSVCYWVTQRDTGWLSEIQWREIPTYQSYIT